MLRNSPPPPPRPSPAPSWYMDEHSIGCGIHTHGHWRDDQHGGIDELFYVLSSDEMLREEAEVTKPQVRCPNSTHDILDSRPGSTGSPVNSAESKAMKQAGSMLPAYPGSESLQSLEATSSNVHQNTFQMDRGSSLNRQYVKSVHHKQSLPKDTAPSTMPTDVHPFPVLARVRNPGHDVSKHSMHSEHNNHDVIELKVVTPTGVLPRCLSLAKGNNPPTKICTPKGPSMSTSGNVNPELPKKAVTRTTIDPADIEARQKTDNAVFVHCCGREIPWPKYLRNSGSTRRVLRGLVYIIPVILVLLLFLALMPISFVYVEHYQMALKRFRSTGAVEENVTYNPGCYVLGPDAEFLLFTMSGHYVEKKDLAVFSASQMEIWISLKLLYFIRSEELGELYTEYGPEYQDVIDRVITAAIKNRASSLTLDQIRLQRPLVEQSLLNATRDELNDLHADVRFLWFERVDIPVKDRAILMRSLIQQVKAETEIFKQQHLLVTKQTTRYSAAIGNRALEVLQYARSAGSLIRSRAEVTGDRIVEATDISGWGAMCQRLGLTREEHKLSLLLINSLNRMENLYLAPTEAQANFSYSHFPGYEATLVSLH